MGERIIVAQRRGEVVRRLSPGQIVDDGWDAIEQIDGTVTIPEGVTIIAEHAFWLCDMTTVIFPESIQHIAPWAFIGCIYLKKLKLPETYETIGEYAFDDVDLEGDIPAFPIGDPDDPFRGRILSEGAFSKYWEKNHCCPRCGYPLDEQGTCTKKEYCNETRMSLSEGVFLCNAAQEAVFTKYCTPDGDTRLSEHHGKDFESELSDNDYEIEELIHRTRAMHGVLCPGYDYKSHNSVRSSWNHAVFATVHIQDHAATVTIPFDIDTPRIRREVVHDYGLIPENGIANVVFDTTYGSTRKPWRSSPQEQVIIAKTDHDGEIYVCDRCRCIREPHFCYRMPSGDQMYLHIEDNGTCDNPSEFEMKDRWDLQDTLSKPGIWQEIIRQWNQHNSIQVSTDRHIPFYVDTPVHGEKRHWYTDSVILKDARVCVIPDDEDPRPHFHYMRGDGREAQILFEEPAYLEPSVHLDSSGKEDLVRFLQQRRIPKYDFGNNIYGELVAFWEADSSHERVNKSSAMPDYRLLPDE